MEPGDPGHRRAGLGRRHGVPDSRWPRQRASTQPEVPVYLYHARSDQVVAYPQGENLRDIYCAAGVAVTWRPFPGDHLDGAAQSPGAIAFLRDRLAGRPTPGDC